MYIFPIFQNMITIIYLYDYRLQNNFIINTDSVTILCLYVAHIYEKCKLITHIHTVDFINTFCI